MARFLLFVFAASFVALCYGASDPTVKLTGVHDLTPESFNVHVSGGKAALVEFYAPWCGHCKTLVPEYKKLGELVAADPKLDSRVVIAKVDADAHRSLGERFGVSGFPTIKFFPRGKAPSKETVVDYNGGRTAEAFVEYLKKALEADQGFARVEALDSVVKGFQETEDKTAVITQVTEVVGGLEGEDQANGKIYVQMLEKAVAKGGDYLTKEKARLDKMLSGGNVGAAKMDELSRKLSVISAIIGEAEE